MLYEEMRLRPSGHIVRVYSVNSDGVAYIFDPAQFAAQNQGWSKVRANKLVPIDFPINNETVLSNTKKKNAKSRLKLIDATWETTDGVQYDHAHIEDAIKYEAELMVNEAEIAEEQR